MVDAEMEKFQATHTDDRRTLYSYPEAKLIEVKKDTVIGKHFHKKKTEKFILSEGFGTLYLGTPSEIIPMQIGKVYNVKPGQYHEFHLTRGSVMIGLNSLPYDPSDDYRPEGVA